MPRSTVSFVCQECGYDSPAYLGKCPECGNWNTFKEFTVSASEKKGKTAVSKSSTALDKTPEPLHKIVLSPKERLLTGFAEMDTVLGGGIVLGSATLLAGDPGIGKSTLLLQLALNLAKGSSVISNSPKEKERSQEISHSVRNDREILNHPSTSLRVKVGDDDGKTVLYISAEESKEQVAMRAMRLVGESVKRKVLSEKLELPENLFLLSITDVDQIVQIIEETKPDFVVIDSVQTVESEEAGGLAGSVSQIRYATSRFIRSAKQNNIPVFLVGHVTKEGMVAGPMVLSHMVDTVLFLEGEKYTKTRILRSFKNRFGPVDEVGIFLMEGEGMQEVKNPEQIFLSSAQQNKQAPGSVLTVILEGSRPFLIEIQALVVYSKFPMPRRVASGIDNKRVELLLAVLQKHVKLPLETYDVFVNVAGGIKVSDRAVDLGVCLAVYSSLKNKSLSKTVGIGEVGLLGEIRNVPNLTKRVKEAKKLGFTNVVTNETSSNLLEVLKQLGYVSGEKQWKERDERHFTIPTDEEEV